MNTLKIKATKRVEAEINLDLPVFFFNKKGNEYLGIIDENNVINFVDRANYKYVQSTTADIKESAIMEAQSEWQLIRESEFMAAHKALLYNLSLEPQLTDPDDLKSVNI